MKSKILVILAILVLVMAPFAFAQYGYGDDDDGDDKPDKPLSLSLDSSCEENVVTATSGGDPVSEVRVAVIRVGGAAITVNWTDSNGQIKFTDEDCEPLGCCGLTVDVFGSKKGYKKAELIGENLIPCEQCEPPECVSDDQCPTDERCEDGECVPVDCPCGEVRNHACDPYECCADDDCPEGQVCRNHECQPPYECYSDDDCEDTQYCDMPEAVGAAPAGGNCADVTGECGYAENHAWVQYECGDEAGCLPCPEGMICVDHECVAGDMECPATAFVGDEGACEATVDDEPCPEPGCPYVITDPFGNQYTGMTVDGQIIVPFDNEGPYTVTLFAADGTTPIKTMVIQVNPEPAAEEPTPPTVVTGPDWSSLLLLIGLVLLLLLFFWWLRRRGGGRRR